jgi:hypothetical protein
MIKDFRFYKEVTGRWYVDLPEWEGSKDDLEMVAGADTFLEILSQGQGITNVTLSDKCYEGSYLLEMQRLGGEIGGAWYKLDSFEGIEFNMEMWLCDVTSFVFGRLPDIIYFSKNE